MPKKASPDSPEPLEAAGFGLLGDAVTAGDGVGLTLPGFRSGLDPGRGSWTSCPPAVGAPGSGLVIGGAGSGGVGDAMFTGAVGGSAALAGGVSELVLRTGVGLIGGGDSAGSVSGGLLASGSFMRTLPLVPGLVLALLSTVVVGESPLAAG